MQMQNRMNPQPETRVFLPAIVLLLVWVEMVTMACHNEANELLETVDETVYELLANPLGIPITSPSSPKFSTH